MKFVTPSFRRGYKDYVNGFTADLKNEFSSEKEKEYLRGYEAARGHFMNDISYDEDVIGGW